MRKTIKVIKQDYAGRAVLQYTGSVLARHEDRIVIEAFFDRESTPVDEIILCHGDRFIETYFSDRWFNIYEIHEQKDQAIKAWYCNVSFPAEISNEAVYYRDLALDLLVYPDGRQTVLDKEEFTRLPISEDVRSQALRALEHLQKRFNS